MGAQVIFDRRQLLAGGLAALASPAFGKAQVTGPRTIVLSVSATRATNMVVWSPARPRGVALFSTGHSSWPERYARLAKLLTDAGFAVLAPVHVDSMRYPDRARFTAQQGFGERFADMRAASAYAAKTYSGLPVIAAGHSFGALTALGLSGALAGIGPFRDPTVKAVLAYSTPGRIPGLIRSDSYASTAVPLMLVTGDADRLPAEIGYPNQPADHLLPAETSPAGSYALVVAGGDHALADDAVRFGRTAVPARLFVEAYGLGDARALRRLRIWRARPGDRWMVRKAGA